MDDSDLEKNVQEILLEIRDHLATHSDNDGKVFSVRLLAVAKPARTMSTLAPLLFRNSSQHMVDEISGPEALQILGFLVALDEPVYLKAASRAIKEEALRLTSTASATLVDSDVHVSPQLTSIMISQLSTGKDVEVAQNSMEALTACCKKFGPVFTETALRGIVDAWNQTLTLMTTNRPEASTICVRCAAAVVEISVLHDAAMKAAISSSAIELFLRMLTDESDPLLQMSMLDLLEKLASTCPMHHARAHYLFTDAVLNPVLGLAGGLEQGAPDPILGGPALRVVAALCNLGQRDAALFGLSDGDLVRAFHRALHNFKASGELDRLAYVDAISSFASSSETALNLVLDDHVTRDAWLSLSVAQPKLKSSILVSVARVLDPAAEVDALGDLRDAPRISNEMGMKLFSTLGTVNGPESTEMMLALTRSPLPETRLGAYSLLEAVAKLPTGGQLLFTNGGFYEFLIDRQVEQTQEGREAKYAIVQAVLASEVVVLLADEIVRELEKYIAQGPHYVKVLRWEVAEQ